MHIDELDLGVRSHNCLMRAGITTVEQLWVISDDDLRQVKNLSQKCVVEIREKLSGLARKTLMEMEDQPCT